MWFLCKALQKFKNKLNAEFPDRDRKSDGTIGDSAHSARRSSHNPDKRGAVRAIDITHNEEQGINCHSLLAALLASPDRRLWYVIFNGQIYNRKNNFAPAKYTGVNAHKHHLHVSVSDDPALYDDEADWNLSFEKPNHTPAATNYNLKKGDKGGAVRALQTRLAQEDFLMFSDVDGSFGNKTRNAVMAFQAAHGLRVDGLVGNNTARALKLL